MRMFISGGCKNGKSSFAEQYALEQAEGLKTSSERGEKPTLYYIATMKAKDEEDAQRILRHVEARAGKGFQTVEIHENIGKLKEICPKEGSILIDSLTALMAEEMFGSTNQNCRAAGEKVCREMGEVIAFFPNIVIVSDYIYCDLGDYDKTTKNYMRWLAAADRVCAKACDTVFESSFGRIIKHK